MNPHVSKNRSRPHAAVAGLVALIVAGAAGAQCAPGQTNLDVPASTPGSDFEPGADGTLLHRRTGLVWQRCALGQTWNGAGCDGTPDALGWEVALQAAVAHTQQGRSDWRLPNRNELASLIENRCATPALNISIFPDAPAQESWTSSPAVGAAGQAWAVDFATGAVSASPLNQPNAVRLVRGGEAIVD